MKHCEPDIVILDFALNENYEGIKTGDQVAEVISQEFNNLPVIMLSAQKNIQIAVDMFSMHIVDYVVKDSAFHLKLKRILKNLKEMTSLRREIKELKTQSKVRVKRISFVACSVLIFWLFFAKMFM